MSTRSRIGLLHADGIATTIYCHSDGYFGFAGERLHEHWNSAAKAASLLMHGDMSVLGTVIGEKHDFEWRMNLKRDFQSEFDALSDSAKREYLDRLGEPNRYVYEFAEIEKDPRYSYCRYYGRDRGEIGTVASRSAVSKIDFEEYCYLWSETLDMWICACTHEDFGVFKWHPLSEVVELAKNLPWDHRHHYELYSFEEAGIALPTIELPKPVLSPEDQAKADAIEAVAIF